MDNIILCGLFILVLLVGLLLGMRMIKREPQEERKKSLPPIQPQKEEPPIIPVSIFPQNRRKPGLAKTDPSPSSRPPPSIRPVADPAYDEQVASLTATSALDSLLIRLPLDKQKEVSRELCQWLGNAVYAGSRFTKREKEDIGVLGWLHFLDTLRLRSLSVDWKEDYILVVPLTPRPQEEEEVEDGQDY